jgi:hypothetical protein
LLLFLCALGCSRKAKPISLEASSSVSPAPVVVEKLEKHAAQCAYDRDCARMPSSQGQTLLCEQGSCQAYDSKLALRWARAQIPELASYQVDESPKLTDAPWYAEDRPVTLYVRNDWLEAKPRAGYCVALSLQAHEGRLFADLDARGHSTEQSPCSQRLSLGAGVRIWDHRCQDGTPSENGGAERIPFDRVLTRANEKGLTYASQPVQLAPACQWTILQREGCEPRHCEICSAYYLQTKIDYGNTHTGGVPKNVEHELLPASCGPCLPDARAAQVPRLSAIFGRHRFTQSSEDGAAYFYTSQRDCENAQRK